MQGNRDDVISSYVRMRIREWRESGRELQDLARAAGFAKSTPSQVLRGTGVGAKTGPNFAKAFQFATFDEMKNAAWEWWSKQGKAGYEAATAPPTEAMRDAIEAVLGLGQGTLEQLQTILAAYIHPRFLEREKAWWVQTLLAELDRDRASAQTDQRQRAVINETQAEMRAVRERAAAAKKSSTPPPRKRRSA